MKKWKLHIPSGVQDYLPDECYNKRKIENKIRNFFYLSGYNEIETPILEYFDVFFEGKASIEQEKMFKFSEMGGRILALRPDITMPIARITATKLRNNSLPIRLSYISSVYRYEELQFGKQREIAQAGIELLGIGGPRADAEVIATAIRTLIELGLNDFQIDIGQVEFFKGLVEEIGLDEIQLEKLRHIIDQKNMLALESLLNDSSFSSKMKEILLKLPQLYGNSDMLAEATNLTNNTRCKKAIENISQVYHILEDYGLSKYISIDLGMVQSLNYYTGIIFKGITKELGYPICGGGRYDKLISEFGYDIPATGFALGIKRILIALERQEGLAKIPPVDILFVFEKNDEGKGYKMVQSLQKQGLRVECYLPAIDTDDPISYAKKNDIKRIMSINSSITL